MRKTCEVFVPSLPIGSLCATVQAEAVRAEYSTESSIDSLPLRNCSQLWKQIDDGGVFIPPILTDFVNGEVVGLTAVYDKSCPQRTPGAISKLYGDRFLIVHSNAMSVWRIESEQLAISESDVSTGQRK